MNGVSPGDVFGWLTVLREVQVPRKDRPSKPWPAADCECVCGNETTVLLGDLFRSNGTQSCGCLRSEVAAGHARLLSTSNITHGMWHHPLYGTWYGMIARCEHPKATDYALYGGRGIIVCERWHDAATFISDIEGWLGPRPKGKTLDRIMNDHDYRLDNVRWATWSEQMRNRRPLNRDMITGQFTTHPGGDS